MGCWLSFPPFSGYLSFESGQSEFGRESSSSIANGMRELDKGWALAQVHSASFAVRLFCLHLGCPFALG